MDSCWFFPLSVHVLLVLSRVLRPLTRLQPFKTDKKWREKKKERRVGEGGRQREKRERETMINIQIFSRNSSLGINCIVLIEWPRNFEFEKAGILFGEYVFSSFRYDRSGILWVFGFFALLVW